MVAADQRLKEDVVFDCGWGRLIMANTFKDPRKIAKILCDEEPGKRDIAINLREPHVVLSMAPQELFLDPSHHFRLLKADYKNDESCNQGINVRKIDTVSDVDRINQIYRYWDMVPVAKSFFDKNQNSERILVFVAEEIQSGIVLGVITALDHQKIYSDPQKGASLWSLAVDPQTPQSGIGEKLVRYSSEHFFDLGREYIDLSVMHDNKQAIQLYKKLNFCKTSLFFLKNKSAINEKLYTGPVPENQLNPYSMIIINEARRRGIAVELLDDETNLIGLSFGGRTIRCRESLTELTSSTALQICSDKAFTHRVLQLHGLKTPKQIRASDRTSNLKFLEEFSRVVVKPAQGEQGIGVRVDLSNIEEVEKAIIEARKINQTVLLEEFVAGDDLRVLVIKNEVVAAAIRRPAEIVGNGLLTIDELIKKQSRRRSNATGGESVIPLDSETRRCVVSAGFQMETILEVGRRLNVRKTANLHTGGTIHDVTDKIHPKLSQACIKAAYAINIPVVGFDLLVESVEKPDYRIIEANERPGLANHEPQPTAEKFIDLLFPQTATKNKFQ